MDTENQYLVEHNVLLNTNALKRELSNIYNETLRSIIIIIIIIINPTRMITIIIIIQVTK